MTWNVIITGNRKQTTHKTFLRELAKGFDFKA